MTLNSKAGETAEQFKQAQEHYQEQEPLLPLQPPTLPLAAPAKDNADPATSQLHQRHPSGGNIKRILHAVSDRTFRSGDRDRDSHKQSRHSRGSLGSIFQWSTQGSLSSALFGNTSADSIPISSADGPEDIFDKDAAGAHERGEYSADANGLPPTASVQHAIDGDSQVFFARDEGDSNVAGPPVASEMPKLTARTTTFTAQYKAEPVPGMWEGGNSAKAKAREQAPLTLAHKNMPLEPEECVRPEMPWVVEQLKLGERPFSSLFEDDTNDAAAEDNSDDRYVSAHLERKRKRKLAFEVLKRRVSEARIGIPRELPAPTIESFRREDGTVDYTRYGCSLVKHLAETRFSHKLDYRHDPRDPCKLDKFITTLHRLVEVSAPYQRFLVWLYRLARWDNPRLSLWWCSVYFLLLYLGMVSAALWMAPVFVTAYYRLRPSHAYSWLGFERPETSIIPSKVLEDASTGTIGKGLIANHMWDIWRETLGAPVHMYLADLADSMERAKNCVTWQRPWASRAVMLVLTTMAIFSYVVPAIVFQRLFGICIGVQFFFLAPLQLRYQRYRRMVWVVDCLLWHCPTDVELAADTLYPQKLCRKASHASEPKDSGDENTAAKSNTGPTTYLRTVVADMVYAYNPLSKKQHPPITILQTASSTSLDRLVDETEDASDISAVHEALLAGKRLGRKFFHGSGVVGIDDDRYTGLGGDAIGGGDNDNSSFCLPSMMGPAEEREWMRKNNLFKPVSRTYSAESLVSMYKGDIATSPIDLQHTRKLSDASGSSIPADNQPTAHMAAFSESGPTATDGSSHSHEGGIHSIGRVLLARAKGQLSSKFKRTQDQDASSFKAGHLPSPVKRPTLRHSLAISSANMAGDKKRQTLSMMDFMGLDFDGPVAGCGDVDEISSGNVSSNTDKHGAEASGNAQNLKSKNSTELSSDGSKGGGYAEELFGSLANNTNSSSLELTREANDLNALRNKDALSTGHGVDLHSLYAFRCVHNGKYGTLFVTADRFVFRRSRIMGGRRSSVSSYLLSSVVAIRKSTGHFGKSHGIQILLNDGVPYYFYGLPKRDDAFGFLLVRCGNSHAY
ncbi:hypothetical protein LPJ66_002444 [Kickxella alabastrina]|uniref:Uncharacterized protein n=1 Tax=Kickxella alabastrina TaxID=61397 RepID=A0ACC1IQE7_9FUNG|nr:hypothetical protein LPJ66_002444 [Kickxella alabastrina]